MASQNDPLRFVSQLFEIAVWPFQAAAKYQAQKNQTQRNPLSDQQYTPLLLIPAMLLFPLLCLLISFVATGYVLLVLPFVFIFQELKRLFPDAPQYRLRTLVILTAIGPPLLWGIFAFFSLPGTLYWTGLTLLTLVICFPIIALRLNLYRIKL